MENNSNLVIASVREVFGNLSGRLILHTTELVPNHASYSIDLLPRLVKEDTVVLKKGEVIYDTFGKGWEITSIER